MLNDFAIKSVIKEVHHFQIPSPNGIFNTIVDIKRMPLGILEIKFRENKTFIRRNWLNRLSSHKLKYMYTKQTILFAFGIHQQRFLME